MTNGNDLAHPFKGSYGTKGEFGEPVIAERVSMGLTKREYFAGLAAQGLCANGWRTNKEISVEVGGDKNLSWAIGQISVEIADEIIKALNEHVTP